MRKKENSWGKALAISISVLVILAALLVLGIKLGAVHISLNVPAAAEASTPEPTVEQTQIIEETPASASEAVEEPIPEAGPEPTLEPASETTSPDDQGWMLILVNRDNPLPEDYEPILTELEDGQLIDERVYPYLQQMFEAARADGVYPVVAAAYRTAEKQQSLMDEKIQEYLGQGMTEEEAKAEAESWVAVPGTSEHQLGLAVDINADGINSAGYEVYDWLAENAWKYGFINRYPEDKTVITGISNEPWHYRFVGAEAAEEIYRSGLCLEEYLEKLR